MVPGRALAEGPDPVALVKRMESAYGRIQNLSMRFTQISTSAALGRRKAEHGTLKLARPGKMRLEYNPPEPKLFLAAGDETYFYVPQDNQVIVGARSELRAQGVAGLMLDGPPSFLDTYEVREPDAGDGASLAPTPGETVLELRPKAHAGFDRALVAVDEADAIAHRIVIVDLEGNRTEYVFEDVEVNAGLPDDVFTFSPPAGVETIRPEP